jgi:hypothetical protein
MILIITLSSLADRSRRQAHLVAPVHQAWLRHEVDDPVSLSADFSA